MSTSSSARIIVHAILLIVVFGLWGSSDSYTTYRWMFLAAISIVTIAAATRSRPIKPRLLGFGVAGALFSLGDAAVALGVLAKPSLLSTLAFCELILGVGLLTSWFAGEWRDDELLLFGIALTAIGAAGLIGDADRFQLLPSWARTGWWIVAVGIAAATCVRTLLFKALLFGPDRQPGRELNAGP